TINHIATYIGDHIEVYRTDDVLKLKNNDELFNRAWYFENALTDDTVLRSEVFDFVPPDIPNFNNVSVKFNL
ncbi:MAG TPA: hypothetical protein DCM40_10285, partial [Maribacter sp.]|nr:hypothetical protein [Maribacter sp.]